ncbi:MAG: Mycinamicin III 3''-O-methyltransferase [candidate division CPR1 bacterium ADurb.Bin160]|uniref:Mycinamicin III 3''-O-methyltransferase n=1 Tax=candidate division CPR1 bacterium ADurb.Bin160 TaxID=1852826 RepID=A0A1V5ZM57_9BACT|nr:MAG: Mycinamicin III 3''-O-methyltransferase [candidate division CPR1 bacterium ADurb.Bin160]
MKIDIDMQDIRNHSLITMDRLIVLKNILESVRCLPGNAAELGVYRGGTSKLIALVLYPKIFYAFDSFCGLTNAFSGVDKHENGDFSDVIFMNVKNYLNYLNVRICRGYFPETTKNITDSEFCFAHFDGDTYCSCISFLDFFYPRMVKNGVMVFDDYDWHKCPGVKRAINEFLKNKKEIVYEIASFQAMIVKI